MEPSLKLENEERKTMRTRTPFLLLAIVGAFLWTMPGHAESIQDVHRVRIIVASDSILSTIVASLLPSHRYAVHTVLPPGQCPGHYDVKLSDIERMKKADVVVSFRGMPYMGGPGRANGEWLSVDAGERNWMVPDSYLRGMEGVAGRLSRKYPEDGDAILKSMSTVKDRVRTASDALKERVVRAGIAGKAVIASSMQKETLEWMGFVVVGEYGRPEAMSVKDIARLSRMGKERHVILVVDNLQSGPDAGKGVAETLGVPHVVLTNFPSEKGYIPTLAENVDAVLKAVPQRR
jgi:zinc transport system substrate-binding protein